MKPVVHARDHWRSGADPAATGWQSAGEGDNPALESPWTGVFRWAFDAAGDLDVDFEVSGGDYGDVVIYLPGAYWPSVTRTRPGTLADGTTFGWTVSAVDGAVTLVEGTAGGGGGSVAAVDVTYAGSTNLSSTDVEAALDELDAEKVPNGRTITAGAALTGGGDLSANRTLDVAVDGSTIEVSSDALRVKDGGITTAKLSFDPATQAELDAHTGDTSAAHAASAISADSTTLVGTATDVQGVLEELDDAVAALGSPTAASVTVADPDGDFAGTNVEAVLDELYDAIVGGGGVPATDVQTFTAGTGQTWTKPGGAKAVKVIVIGAGAGGGGGCSSVSTVKTGGSGGGGGAVAVADFDAADLTGTVNVDVAAGGAGGAGGAAGAGANGSNGGDGSGLTSFGAYLTAGCGGGGPGGATTNRQQGAGGSPVENGSGSTAGSPSSTGTPIGGQAAASSSGAAGLSTENGGATGGGGHTTTIRAGGSSMNGGPGGGNGGSVTSGNVGVAGGAGGNTLSYTAGGGGAGGTGGGSPTDGTAGTTWKGPYCGQAGGGGGGGSAVAGKNGGNGGIGAGGGGGGASSSASSSAAGGDGGDGGDGRVIVVTYF